MDPSNPTPRALRIRSIRRRTAAAAVAAFALAFGVIAETGSLGATPTASTKASTSAAQSYDTEDYLDDGSYDDGSALATNQSASTNQAPAAVTTQQS